MKTQTVRSAIFGASLLSCVIATEAIAQNAYGQGYDDNVEQMTLLRLCMIIFSIGLGYGVGWLFSPQAKDVRTFVAICVAGLLSMVALLNHGVLGWGLASLISFIGFFVMIGYWLSGILSDTPTTFGSSRWAKEDDLKDNNVLGDGGVRLGEFKTKDGSQAISYKGDRHLLTVAPTRSGKGTTQIIPNLLTYTGSMLVIDPKGENALITAKARQDMGQDIHIVDPWGIAQVDGIKTARFNPLDWLQISDVDITENAMLLADALIISQNSNDTFWDEEAKALLQGLILYVATQKSEEGKRTLKRVRELLLLEGDALKAHFKKMSGSGHHIVASTGARCLQKEEKLLANVMATTQAQTHFLDSARIQENLEASDFKFEDLKTKQMTIYLVLPADRLNAFSRWLRLLVQQAITMNARNIDVKPEKPVLFILDEFAALGRLTMVEQAYGLMAGFG